MSKHLHYVFIEKTVVAENPANVIAYEDSQTVTIGVVDLESDPMTIAMDVKGYTSAGVETTYPKVESFEKADWVGSIEYVQQ